MNHQSDQQPTQPQRQWRRLSLVALTLGSLLLINMAFFARSVSATATPEATTTNAPSPTDAATPTAPVKVPRPPYNPPFVWLLHPSLAAFALVSLLIVVRVVTLISVPAASGEGTRGDDARTTSLGALRVIDNDEKQ